MPVTARQNALQAGVAAALMLFFGWGFALSGSGTPFYNTTVDVFNWVLRIGGIALLVVAGLCAADFRIGLLLDSLVSGVCGAFMVVIAIYWLIATRATDLQDFIFLIFGGMFVSAAMSAMRSYRAMGANGGSPTGGAERTGGVFGVPQGGGQRPRAMAVTPGLPRPAGAPDATAVHPASVRPASLPKESEPPPPEGYLTALAKEKDEPPTASYE